MIDESIILKAMAKDRQAFRALFNNSKQRVYKTAYLILKDCQLAEDVVQEAFLQVHLNLHKLENPESFEGWLYKITVNLCYRMLRKSSKDEPIALDEEGDNIIPLIQQDYEIPEVILMKKETRKKFMECIASLPINHQLVLTLYYFNDLKIKDIAGIMNCSEGTVKSRLFYGKKILKEVLCIEVPEIINKKLGVYAYESR